MNKAADKRSGQIQLAGEGWVGDVRRQLAVLTSDEAFTASVRGRRLLRYLAEECLAGRSATLKQFAIAQDVFGRGDDFDPQSDPVVRAEAAKLRRALDLYYAVDGKEDAIRFELPKGGYAILFHRQPSQVPEDDTQRRRFANSLPRLAVAPIASKSNVPDAHLYATGLTHGLIAGLSRFDGLEVIGHHTSVAVARNGAIEADQIHELNLDLVLTGTVRWGGNRIRLTLELSETETSSTVWSEIYDQIWSPDQAFDIEDKICADVVAKVANSYGAVASYFQRPGARSRVKTDGAYSAAMTFYNYNLNHTTFEHTRSLLRQTVDVEPSNALVLSMLAELEADAVALRLSDDTIEMQAAREIAERAARLDPNCQQSQQTLGFLRMHCHDFQGAVQAYERCISLNPNAAYLIGFSGWGIALCGHWESGLAHLKKACRLNPMQPGWLKLAPLLHHWINHDYKAAHINAIDFKSPGIAWDPLLRSVTAWRIGEKAMAREAAAELTANHPEFEGHEREYLGRFVYRSETVDQMLETLEEAKL
ncbi:hypothetical protein [Labrenzia sp. VG12]|uniref:hypothetical protein n=1 Tax=Labrenzia sp. VG12 TaxID=2021862 RepID=UPI000B8C6A32|nr:hypothetical protein [Labrenzia sp. VG12]ASP34092.1 hypothetical protein CHH27_13255 [Labrenzia sp. VG12]